MRIAFLGNSHLAAIKLGWDAGTYGDEHEALFFGSTRDKMKALRVTDGVVHASDAELSRLFHSSAGRNDVPADCDLYVLVGLQSAMTRAMGLLRTHVPHTLRHPSRAAPLISRSVLRATINEQVAFGLTLRTLRTLRQVTDAPVVLLPDPLVSHAALGDDRYWYWRDPTVRLDIQAIHASAIAEFISPVMTVCRQPPGTVVDHTFTRPEYMRNATRLGSHGYTAALGDEDMIHANGDFGIAMLKEMFTTLRSDLPEGAA